MPKIDTIIVEDHEITRLGIRKMLENMERVSIVGEQSLGEKAVLQAMELQPDLVLMDIGLPDLDGIEATRRIKKELPAKVILITVHDAEQDIVAGLSAGADAFCLKGIREKQLQEAIYCVMDNGVWLDPGIGRQLIGIILGGGQNSKESFKPGFRLSDREKDVLALLIEGMSNQEMARKLKLSPETIKTHMKHLMEKLGVSDRTQAAVKAMKEGLLSTARTDPDD